jgi:3-oxoacyl-[acyl-carrier protein] reductase
MGGGGSHFGKRVNGTPVHCFPREFFSLRQVQIIIKKYSTAKGAILTFTRALADEFGSRGVRVSALASGLGTSFHNTHTTPESAKATVAGIPLGRGGNADDVARAAVFLASEYDGFITGATLDINGGVYAN